MILCKWSHWTNCCYCYVITLWYMKCTGKCTNYKVFFIFQSFCITLKFSFAERDKKHIMLGIELNDHLVLPVKHFLLWIIWCYILNRLGKRGVILGPSMSCHFDWCSFFWYELFTQTILFLHLLKVYV